MGTSFRIQKTELLYLCSILYLNQDTTVLEGQYDDPRTRGEDEVQAARINLGHTISLLVGLLVFIVMQLRLIRLVSYYC